MKGLFALLAAFVLATGAIGKEAAPLAEDEAVEKRLLNIAEELRCLVCQNESLAGSRADLAEDLRREVRGLIKQGKTDQEVKDFLVSRYARQTNHLAALGRTVRAARRWPRCPVRLSAPSQRAGGQSRTDGR